MEAGHLLARCGNHHDSGDLVSPEETQTCKSCKERKPLSAYRRHCKGHKGRDSMCKACRKADYEAMKAKNFGSLPEQEGSEEWAAEVRRRAETIRRQNEKRDTAQNISA